MIDINESPNDRVGGPTNTSLRSIDSHSDKFVKLISKVSDRIVETPRPVNNVVLSRKKDAPNILLEASTFTVCARVRPMLENECNGQNFTACVAGQRIVRPETMYTEQMLVCTPKLSVRGIPKILKKTYDFDYAFGADSTNEEVFEFACKPLVNRALNGQIGVVFAYGQTGSGKTHTMNGIMDHVIKSPEIFDGTTELSFSYLEMLGTEITDCLACHQETGDTESPAQDVKIVESLDGRTVLLNLSTHSVNTSQDLMELVEIAKSSRAVQTTLKNTGSSRSHGIGILSCKDKDSGVEGQLYLIDLAGSERAADSASHNKERMAETKAVNASLSSLKECIRARTLASQPGSKKVFVPYRRSKLTVLMKDIFDVGCPRNCSTVMLSMCSPLAADVSHTANTLKYSSPLRAIIEPNKSRVQIQVDKRDPLLWTNTQVLVWLKDAFPVAAKENNFLGVLSGAQLCALSEEEWYTRVKEAGDSEKLGKDSYLAMWTMVSDAKTRQRISDGSIITEADEEMYRNNIVTETKRRAEAWAL